MRAPARFLLLASFCFFLIPLRAEDAKPRFQISISNLGVTGGTLDADAVVTHLNNAGWCTAAAAPPPAACGSRRGRRSCRVPAAPASAAPRPWPHPCWARRRCVVPAPPAAACTGAMATAPRRSRLVSSAPRPHPPSPAPSPARCRVDTAAVVAPRASATTAARCPQGRSL